MTAPQLWTSGRMLHLEDCGSFKFTKPVQSRKRQATAAEMETLRECARCDPRGRRHRAGPSE